MTKRLKLNVLNIASGYQNLNDVFSGQETRIYNGFSRLVIPKSIPLRKLDCKYYQQDYVKSTTQNFAKLVLSEPLRNTTVARNFSHIPLTGKWLTTAHTFPPVTVTPWFSFPFQTSYNFYYDVKNPRCPPPAPKTKGGESPCGNQKKGPVCPPTTSKVDPCSRKSKPKSNPCQRRKCTFTVPMKLCRFFSTKACPPRKGGGKGSVCGGRKGGAGGDDKPRACRSRKEKAGGGGKPRACGSRQGGGGKPRACGSRKGGGDKPRACGSRKGGGGKPRACGSRKGGGNKPRACAKRGSGGGKPRACAKRGGGGKNPCGGRKGGAGRGKNPVCGGRKGGGSSSNPCAGRGGGGKGGHAVLPERKCGGGDKSKKPKCRN
ncbi:hypothetical protein HW555_001933 [Spodoptera exigua]|uniref:Uncharacterized protein n=1 Tax=Spodoptera exigua TaxID=7107 RepID=A0A835L9X3_SPOEX|nr:hypothetical protein HW555_001933 [Spodoptera exigua]